MSTQAVQALHRATVVRSWDETAALRSIALDVPAEVSAAHAAPGQYMKLAVSPGVEGFFALANAPGRPVELLVKRGTPVADALAALEAGAPVDVTVPLGKGYPVREHTGRDLVLLAAGSGIAPLRAVVQHVISDRPRWGAVRLLYGHRHPDEFAYAAEEPVWRQAGVEVTRVVSGGAEGWTGARGHVQDLLRTSERLDGAVFYVCGMKAMVSDVHAALAILGIDRTRIYLNF